MSTSELRERLHNRVWLAIVTNDESYKPHPKPLRKRARLDDDAKDLKWRDAIEKARLKGD